MVGGTLAKGALKAMQKSWGGKTKKISDSKNFVYMIKGGTPRIQRGRKRTRCPNLRRHRKAVLGRPDCHRQKGVEQRRKSLTVDLGKEKDGLKV